MDLLLDDYGKSELEPSYYDYDVLDDADKGKNIYNDLNLLRFFQILNSSFYVEKNIFKTFDCLLTSAIKCWVQMRTQTKFCLDY